MAIADITKRCSTCNGTGDVSFADEGGSYSCPTCVGTGRLSSGRLDDDLIDLLNDMKDKLDDIKEKVDEL